MSLALVAILSDEVCSPEAVTPPAGSETPKGGDSPLGYGFRFGSEAATWASGLLERHCELQGETRGEALQRLAADLGVSEWTVYRWARGITTPQGVHARILR